MASAMPTAAAPASPTNAARPTGVTILAVLAFIGGAFAILGGLMLAVVGSAFGSMFESGLFAMLGAAVGVFVIVLGVLYLGLGFGLWTRKTWGWWIAIVLAALGILGSLSTIMAGDFFSAIFGLAIQGFVIWYLTAPGVQSWFGTNVNVPWHKTA